MILRDLLIEAAKIAGNIQKDILYSGNSGITSRKSDRVQDVVTIADKKCELALRSFFHWHLPEYNIFGEELGAQYNGNGRAVVIDPVDGTLSFGMSTPKKIHAGFGPIIGVYEGCRNVGGVAYNTINDVMFVATEETGFERIGNDTPKFKNAIYVSGSFREVPSFHSEMERQLKETFPDNPILCNFKDTETVASMQDVVGMSRVCDKGRAAYFHPGIAWHDISSMPLFGKLTETPVTDHNGITYEKFNIEKEFKKYQLNTHDAVYSHPILIARPEYHDKMLRILEKYKPVLDKKQNPDLA
jgi:fructose-1,6-bisphosphatase/inositol monophosphatase family enzyme